MGAKNIAPEIVAQLCLQKYKELPKTGKPTDEQWSVLAGIVMYNTTTKNMRVVSLGVGTKCIGAGKMCKNGFILNDSHAEVLARRGLLRFLYNELRTTNSTPIKESIFSWNTEKLAYELKSDYSFHFFCTQPPCGDACIAEEICEEPPAKQRKLSDSSDDDIGAVLSTVYTGAKLFEQINEQVDCMAQTIGALRIKPGRGDRTLSMSCSDKMSRWCVLGIQGALLDALLTSPIYLSTLNFCANTNEKAIKRAIYERWKCKAENQSFKLNRFKQHVPEIQICKDCTLSFECQQTAKKKQPSPTAISWCEIPKQLKNCEIIVDGKRQGCTKKSIGTCQAALRISKYYLFREFIDFLKNNDTLRKKLFEKEEHFCCVKYREAKNLAFTYQSAWALVKSEYFGQWTKKPISLEEFLYN